jgi:hypothetical protein
VLNDDLRQRNISVCFGLQLWRCQPQLRL